MENSIFFFIKLPISTTSKLNLLITADVLPKEWAPWVYIDGECPERCFFDDDTPNQERLCLKNNITKVMNDCPGQSHRARKCNMKKCGEYVRGGILQEQD